MPKSSKNVKTPPKIPGFVKKKEVSIDKRALQMLRHGFSDFVGFFKVKVFGVGGISIDHLVFTPS